MEQEAGQLFIAVAMFLLLRNKSSQNVYFWKFLSFWLNTCQQHCQYGHWQWNTCPHPTQPTHSALAAYWSWRPKRPTDASSQGSETLIADFILIHLNACTLESTRSSAVTERPRDASCHLICRWITQGHSRSFEWHHLIVHIWVPIGVP